MRDFPIDDKNEIGRKKVKVSSSTIKNMYESKLRDMIRQEITHLKEDDLEKGGSSLPSKLKIYMARFTDEVNKAKLNKKKKIAILFKVIKSLGVNPQELNMYVAKIRKNV